MSRWNVRGRREVHESEWVGLALAEVELPDGRLIEHHVLHFPRPSVSLVAADPGRGVLMIRRHRFIPDSWGWEVPSGRAEEGESLEAAAARETLEETGWRPGRLEYLGANHPMPGIADMVHHVFLARDAVHVGDPSDPHEASRVDWIPVVRLPLMIRSGEVPDGYSQLSLLWAMSLGRLRGWPRIV